MTVKPLKGMVYLKIEEPQVGVLNTSSKQTAVEFAEVLATGEGVTDVKKGDKVFVKAWAVDIIDYQDQKYYFVNIETNGLIAIVK